MMEEGIMEPAKLESRIAHINAKRMPCTEGDTDMAKRQRIPITLPTTGEKVWLTGNTMSEAFANGLEKYGGGVTKQETKKVLTLREFVDNTYRPSFMVSLTPKTIDSYESYLSLNILPFMGDMPMNEITVTTIQSFYNWMATASQRGRKSDLNAKSIERISGFLGKIFRVAVEMKIITDSPIKKTLLRNPGQPAGHHKAIPYEIMDEVKRTIPKLTKERERLYMALLAYAGMRPEEVLGMKWENVHLDKGYCDVVRTVTHTGTAKTITIRDEAKTPAGIRTVVLPLPAIQILETASHKDGYVLGGDKPLCYSTFKRTYQSAFKQMGIEGKFNNYDFRTTYGTELCEAGLSSKQVGDMMGHADTRMVETVYARSRHEGIMRQRDMLNAMNQAYAN